MKKLVLLIVIILSFLTLRAQDYFELPLSKSAIEMLNTADQQKLVIFYIVIRFDIGRPKFRCRRGFWFCNRKNYPDEYFKPEYDPSIEGLLLFNLEKKQVTLFLPKSDYFSKLLKEMGMFGNKDAMPIKIGRYIIKPNQYKINQIKMKINDRLYNYAITLDLQ